MAAPPSAYRDRHFLAVIGDEVDGFVRFDRMIANFQFQDSVTGLLLAGIGVYPRSQIVYCNNYLI